MAKIIQFDPTKKKPKTVSPEKSLDCEHKRVIAYTAFRTVRCAICGAQLDPFDVLVDMLKSYVEPGANNLEEKRLAREVEKRSRKKRKEDEPSPK